MEFVGRRFDVNKDKDKDKDDSYKHKEKDHFSYPLKGKLSAMRFQYYPQLRLRHESVLAQTLQNDLTRTGVNHSVLD